ncbi:unnamed protein product [Phaedon cochleariae]|uniref:Uncharacterized protein n=1 Tax=Phaedon cochleariae TaxID=80249 RepID=A0A9P0DU38_PHACE|nr:unnamed protein product [Phaedon cochleariae]
MDHFERDKRIKNPRETANIFSILTFAHTRILFKRGLKHDLEEKDLYNVAKCCDSKRCGDKLQKSWLEENKLNKNSSIYRLLWKRFGYRYLFIGLIDGLYKILISSILEPLALSKVISYFDPSQKEMTQTDAYYYSGFLLFSVILNAVYYHNSLFWAAHLGIEIKTAFSSLLYRKALKLSPSSISSISLGNIVTLITKDVYTFQNSIWVFNDIWSGTLQTCVICYLLYRKIGYVSFLGIFVIMSAIPLQSYLGRCISKLRISIGKKTDERVQDTQETLSTIRIIKMYTWEIFFGDRIQKARSIEMSKILISYYFKMIIITVGLLFSKFGFYLLIMAHIWMGYSPSSELVFYIISIFKELEYDIGFIIPSAIGEFADLYSAIQRINMVIQAEELPSKEIVDGPIATPFIKLEHVDIHIKDIEILNNVSFETRTGLTVITGKVGSGKSSLLKTMLQDYPVSGGSLKVHGRISYASQDPWLFPSTIRQNILFGETFEEKRYQEVIRICALFYDFNLLENGDETIVTDRGANLSGGQQARVNLARAIYKNSDIYLLDDSLAALDSQVQDFIFNECILKFLNSKICILVSQNLNHIQKADQVVIMEGGQIKSSGTIDQKILNNLSSLANRHNLEKYNGSNSIKHDEADESLTEEAVLLETEQGCGQKIYSEIKKQGKVDFDVYKKYAMFGGGALMIMLNVTVFGLAQGCDSYSDKLLTTWVDKQQVVLDLGNSTSNSTNLSSLRVAVEDSQYTIKLYSISIFVSAIMTGIKTYFIFDFCRRASVNIHKSMIGSMMNALMSFFDTHFLGNILNRFSQDLNSIDEHLPLILGEVFRSVFSIIGIIVLIVTVNSSFLAYALVIFLALLMVRRVYMPTGRSLKRLEASTRSPMIGHLNASLEGLTTIRACGIEETLINEFDRHQNLFTSAHFIGQTTTRAFGLWMDLICSLYVCIVVISFIFFESNSTAGDVGLALTQVLLLSSEVQWSIRQWSDLENLMTSVERLVEYTDVKAETTGGTEVEHWPQAGSITYKNVSLTYNNNETVLKNLTFEIKPGEKIGIVGRTGAGKSSIIATIFRLYEADGSILIDNVDIKTLYLKYLRKHLAIIPQEPVLFSGSIRTNLDPFQEFQDADIWKALGQVNLKSAIHDLNAPVKNHSSNFSSGQRQLICLARSILRRNKILILDEASANMDSETDSLLQAIIKDNFAECTVLTIAHRLQTILQSDRVMVLDRGEIVQFDSPNELLKNTQGIFYEMINQAGLLKKY